MNKTVDERLDKLEEGVNPKAMDLRIRNFRSIKDQTVRLAPLTVVYGPNGAGKSSLLYALLTLKNIVLNPNQSTSGFFNYVFISLGSFDAVVFDHQKRGEIDLGISSSSNGGTLIYQVSIGETDGRFSLSIDNREVPISLGLPVSFPYPANQQSQQQIEADGISFIATWNGITAQVQSAATTSEAQEKARHLAGLINRPVEMLRRVSMVPLRRGFSKPHYSTIPVSPLLITEDEVATFLAQDKYLRSKVSFYLEDVVGRDFQANFQPATSIFSLDATDNKTGVASELVNEGFGVNQIVYVLAQCLHPDVEWVCIEEPEIHLHPTAIRSFAKALGRIVHEEGKRFIISTHSETFVLGLLNLVAGGSLQADELACYYARKDRKTTTFERQVVHESGQMEGGLGSFLEGEMEEIRAFLKSRQEAGR